MEGVTPSPTSAVPAAAYGRVNRHTQAHPNEWDQAHSHPQSQGSWDMLEKGDGCGGLPEVAKGALGRPTELHQADPLPAKYLKVFAVSGNPFSIGATSGPPR